MRKNMENIIPAAAVVIMILVFAFLAGQKVYGQTIERVERERRDAMESTYIAEVKETLRDSGFVNSGVNLTKETNASGDWEYTLVIYNRSFDWMEDGVRADLEKELADMANDELGKISLALLSR
ncbi:MAG: hypothetical protein IJ336_06330 [Lachnospiraceae bacterium]|nr:hypothetical protein [Lachnospiraceae bacterium]